MIVASNFPDPILLVDNDRRYNVAPAQERPLRISPEELKQIDDGELWFFVSYLMHYPADLERARTVLHNEARSSMIVASQASQDAFFSHIRQGDLDYLLDYLREDMPVHDIMGYQRYEQIVIDWTRQYSEHPDGLVRINRDDLRDAFQYATGMMTTPTKFSRMCGIYRINLKRLRDGEQFFTGREICFHSEDPGLVKAALAKAKRKHLRLIKGDQDDE